MSLPAPSSDVTEVSSPAVARPHHWARDILETVLFTAIVYAALNFATGRFRVENISMQPNLHAGQYVLVDKVSYRIGRPQRGDIVVLTPLSGSGPDLIKRVIGLPGETVSVANGVVSINGRPLDEPYLAAAPRYVNTWSLGPGEYFVLGDNRNNSSDSHVWGPLKREHLVGRAIFIYWPPGEWGSVPHYRYDGLE